MEKLTYKGRQLTREAVAEAIAECDRLGRRAFLDRHGYGHRYASERHARSRSVTFRTPARVSG